VGFMSVIEEVVRYLAELKNGMSAFEDEIMDDLDPCYFLSKADVVTIKSYSKIPSSKWSTSMICKSYEIINTYKSDILDLGVNLDNIEVPDFKKYKLEKSSPKIKILDNKIFIHRAVIKKYNYIETSKPINDEFVEIKINPKNIFEIIKGREDKNLIIPSDVLSFINIYLNNINYDDNIEDFGLKKIHGYSKDLMEFQQIGCLFGLLNKKILLADEMGLGKSVEALAIAREIKSKKILIVCPKSLKYKWEKESSYMDGCEIEIINKGTILNNLSKDIYITNYDNIKNIAEYFESSGEDTAIIFDECHYLKNPKSKRSKICLKIAKNKNVVILLSGSPMLNRPSELVNQLDTLGALENFGGYTDFKEKYDQPEEENVDYLYEELSKKLRSSVYIRREKSKILKDLPDKQRTTIKVDIDYAEYKTELLCYKQETDLKKKKQILEKLKQIAAHGKYDAIKERIDLSIENDEKLIVFAYHKSLQERLILDYPDALKIISSQNETERNFNADLFQSDSDKKIIICSIGVAYYGFDLFASSQVLFAEMDWIPEINIQAEDRAHRIGQKNCVNIWYLIARNTIEERILKANIDKSKITKKVNKSVPIESLNNKSKNLKDDIITYLDELNI
jgi:SWI/SNF-related matrix-associated actin-dependent regulator of chromatin subfamily A-like protein 1